MNELPDKVYLYDTFTTARLRAEQRQTHLREQREILSRSLAAVENELSSLPSIIARYTEQLEQLHLDYRIVAIEHKIEQLQAEQTLAMRRLRKRRLRAIR